MSSRKKFQCLDCKVDTGKLGEHYMLTDKTWYRVHGSNVGMLCIGCLENRLGRKLIKNDFNESHVNRVASGKFFSQRFINRLELSV